MNIKKLTLVTLGAGIGMWIVAGIWHNLIMANLYQHVHAQHEGIGIMLVAYIILGLIMAYLYPKIHKKNGRPILEGLKFGAIIGILWVFPHELAMTGTHDGKSIIYVIKNGAWHMVEQGIGGMVIGLIYSKFK